MHIDEMPAQAAPTFPEMRRRTFRALPPECTPTPELAALAAEHEAAVQRLGAAHSRARELAAPEVEAAAKTADAQELAQAARRGQDLASIGSAALDQLTDQRNTASRETLALLDAVDVIEAELSAAYEANLANDQTSGRAALAAAAKRYDKAVAAVDDARGDFVRKADVVRFFAEAPNATADRPVRPPSDNGHGPAIAVARASVRFAELIGALQAEADQPGRVIANREGRFDFAELEAAEAERQRIAAFHANQAKTTRTNFIRDRLQYQIPAAERKTLEAELAELGS